MVNRSRIQCIQPGCREYGVRQNRCFRHWQAWRINPPPPSLPGYGTVHRNCVKRWGRPGRHACRHCGYRAEQWAYNHLDPNEKTEGVLLYSDSTSYYMPLCTLCHGGFDADYRRARRDGTLPAFLESVPNREVEPRWSYAAYIAELRAENEAVRA